MTPLTIKPAAPPLTKGAHAPRRVRLPSSRSAALATAAVALLAVLGWIVFALPGRIAAPEPAAAPPPASDVAQAAKPAATRNVTPPFRRLERERAERAARESLGRFVELQRQLTGTMNVAAWGEAELAAALDRAMAADRLFLAERYEDSLAEYEAAGADLAALLQRGRALHDAALQRGEQGLDDRQPIAAANAFAAALAIQPQSAAALAGARRASAQPQVLSLMREGERARLRGDLPAAISLFNQARAIDPGTTGLDAALRQTRAQLAQNAHEARLSAGFKALEAARHEQALAAFEAALAARPEDPAALSGLQQTRQQQTLARITGLRTQAREREESGDWQGALESYAAALALDPTLSFAQEGQARVGRRVGMLAQMNALLADPAALSEDAAFAAAETLLHEVRQVGPEREAGGAWHETARAFANLMAHAAAPLPLVLVSDNATEVTIFRVGPLGRFQRRELSLRPGRYTILGSRDGCRDVRKEIVVAPNMTPVAVLCEERI